ncbi:MAG: hypothetical protein LKI93_04905 [Bifidobacteriaceae bacterium]|jgi:hypothetical protein|nr:hypothetical protein [Bifidobacteriaceae bacterium]MCI1914386.1 hypothetical protein [Bifidobacteriaceae bacterium]MCI1935838.1 hypothetical protein [Bifidobacteriaceae bacterium]
MFDITVTSLESPVDSSNAYRNHTFPEHRPASITVNLRRVMAHESDVHDDVVVLQHGRRFSIRTDCMPSSLRKLQTTGLPIGRTIDLLLLLAQHGLVISSDLIDLLMVMEQHPAMGDVQ